MHTHSFPTFSDFNSCSSETLPSKLVFIISSNTSSTSLSVAKNETINKRKLNRLNVRDKKFTLELVDVASSYHIQHQVADSHKHYVHIPVYSNSYQRPPPISLQSWNKRYSCYLQKGDALSAGSQPQVHIRVLIQRVFKVFRLLGIAAQSAIPVAREQLVPSGVGDDDGVKRHRVRYVQYSMEQV